MKRKILFIIALSLMLVGLCQQSIKYLVKRELGLTEVYVASHTIDPRKKIEIEDIEVKLVPKAYLSENVLVNKEDIIGKYNLVDHYIFKDSFFYKESLENINKMKDYPLYLLEDDQVLYEIEISDIDCPRFIIGSNQHGDLYVTIKDSKNVISDLLIENVEIVAAYDSKGVSLKEKGSNTIYSIVLAIDESLINILNIAKNKGDLSFYLKADTYSNKKESVLKKDSYVLNYLNLVE